MITGLKAAAFPPSNTRLDSAALQAAKLVKKAGFKDSKALEKSSAKFMSFFQVGAVCCAAYVLGSVHGRIGQCAWNWVCLSGLCEVPPGQGPSSRWSQFDS